MCKLCAKVCNFATCTRTHKIMKISILVRTQNPNGNTKIRFRITHKGTHIYYPTDISVPIRELKEKYVCSGVGNNFTCSGELKPKVLVYNTKIYDRIRSEIDTIELACKRVIDTGTPLTSDEFGNAIRYVKNPNAAMQESIPSLQSLFKEFVERTYKARMIGKERKSIYDRVLYSINLFLVINRYGSEMLPSDFTTNMLYEIREFFRDEYKYVAKYPKLFTDCRRMPTKQRSDNTVANRMNVLKVYFEDLVLQRIISESPFDRINKGKQREIFKREYDDPIYLTFDEYQKVRDTDAPDQLKETKDIFILNCLLGCRINELCKLKRSDIHIEQGIPYYAYLPSKTIRSASRSKGVINKPLMKTALEILKSHDFHFPQLRYISGSRGYNIKLKQLLVYCGIDRQVQITDNGKVIYMPISECASTKIARKTHIETMQQFQFDVLQYDANIAGLHRNGSTAIDRYGNAPKLIVNQFNIMCLAFGENAYRVDETLNIIK